MKRALIVCAATPLLATGIAQAHHSYAAYFEVDERIRVEGVVEEFFAQNPHAYIVFNVADENGEAVQWRAEMPGWVGLRRGIWTADDLKPGDPVTIVGAPARSNDATLIRADDIVMPDGWTRHLFVDRAIGRTPPPTPPSGTAVAATSPAVASTAFYAPARTDGDWPGLDIVWRPNSGRSTDPRDVRAARYNFDEAPLTEKARQAWAARSEIDDPGLRCIKPTLLVSMTSPNPLQIARVGDHIRLQAERWDTVRTIFMDGRAAPPRTPHTINGFSVGRFEDDTLVVETSHITAGWELTGGAPPHSDALRVTEQYRVTDNGQRLELTSTVEDPETFTEPVSWTLYHRPANIQAIHPYDCQPSPGGGYSWEDD
jgi:hypothetical protein